MNTEKYAVEFIQKDIGYYREQLIVRIEYIEGLKERLSQFFEKELEISRQLLDVKYEFEYSQEKSTIKTALFSSPIKNPEDVNPVEFRTPTEQSKFY